MPSMPAMSAMPALPAMHAMPATIFISAPHPYSNNRSSNARGYVLFKLLLIFVGASTQKYLKKSCMWNICFYFGPYKILEVSAIVIHIFKNLFIS